MTVADLRKALETFHEEDDVYVVAEEFDCALPCLTVIPALRGRSTDAPIRGAEHFLWVASRADTEAIEEFREEFAGGDEIPAVIIKGSV